MDHEGLFMDRNRIPQLPFPSKKRSQLATACHLQVLPVDTRMEDMKELLKRSQLGRNVMFLYKCSDETPDNKRMAMELVHKWARPVFYDQDAEDVSCNMVFLRPTLSVAALTWCAAVCVWLYKYWLGDGKGRV